MIVKVGDGGQVCLFTQSATNLVVDVDGYFPVGVEFVVVGAGSVVGVAAGLVDG